MNNEQDQRTRESAILGQRYAYATASLLVGIASFVQLLGVERAILAIVFGWLALKKQPSPALKMRRGWAKAGVTLGIAMIPVVLFFVVFHFEKFRAVVELLNR